MKHNYLPKILSLGLMIALLFSCEENPKEDKTITISGNITQDSQWTADNSYLLDNQVTVFPGVTLTIDPGTVIKAKAQEAPNVSMLIIAKGAKLIAKGTAEKPIIFTSINDNLDQSNGTKSLLNDSDTGLWGGLIILGDAPVSLMNGDNETFYIGLDSEDKNSYYGGDNPHDNSGIIEYVSIRHGGVFIGTGSESNGLTLCGVGDKTTINQIEIFSNQDDGIEFFGGTVNVNNLLVHANYDDGIDIDEGYTGTISNFLIELIEDSDYAIEINGGQGETNGSFTLTNGLIDGMGLENTMIYSIGEKAKGVISNVKTINAGESTTNNINSKEVVISAAEEEAEIKMNFDWTRAKEN